MVRDVRASGAGGGAIRSAGGLGIGRAGHCWVAVAADGRAGQSEAAISLRAEQMVVAKARSERSASALVPITERQWLKSAPQY